MIHGDSYHAGYKAGYHEGQRDLKQQLRHLINAPILMSGSQPARALADAVKEQRAVEAVAER